jgi:hypothetical protein
VLCRPPAGRARLAVASAPRASPPLRASPPSPFTPPPARASGLWIMAASPMWLALNPSVARCTCCTTQRNHTERVTVAPVVVADPQPLPSRRWLWLARNPCRRQLGPLDPPAHPRRGPLVAAPGVPTRPPPPPPPRTR